MLDRTVPPPSQSVTDITFPWPQSIQLPAGIPLFVLNSGSQPITKLELLFASGTWYEPQHGVAYFTAKMLQEGTQKKTSQEIAACLDYYGAELTIEVKPDYCSLALVTLSKYLSPVLALLAELLSEPTFPPGQLQLLKNLKTQAIKIEDAKPRHVARKQFKLAILGQEHPYGQNLTAEDIALIAPEHLQQYYQGRLLADCQVLVSGSVSDQDIQRIQSHLQHLPWQQPAAIAHPWAEATSTKVKIPRANSLQSTIHIGKVLFPKDHPDYLPVRFVCDLLGGYFGSRLMRNIREEKGYTYGIHAGIVSLKHTSYFLIDTEVIQNFAEQACQEIYREINTLQTHKATQEELHQLRSYLLGDFLVSVNDPFSIMDRFKEAHLHGLDQNFYQRFYDTLYHISPQRIQELANQYLSLDSLTEVCVG
ncbi:MAG: pitrilysin family protein [Bacteroidota bacterium]